jgi:biopolymer transport protein TolR
MAGVTEQGSNGNKLDVALNLVPFIDLLSTLVLFLLLTVVWVQIAAVQASVDSKGKSTISNADQSKLVITLKPEGVDVTWPSPLVKRGLPRQVKSLDVLEGTLQKLLQEGQVLPASVGGDDRVEYGAVIQALDYLKTAGLTNVALSTD